MIDGGKDKGTAIRYRGSILLLDSALLEGIVSTPEIPWSRQLQHCCCMLYLLTAFPLLFDLFYKDLVMDYCTQEPTYRVILLLGVSVNAAHNPEP